jgi:hypothetical protein
VSVEQLLRDTLHEADAYAPSPDLFKRVQRSIAEDRAHRRRVRLALALLALGLTIVAAYLAATVEVVDGQLSWPWWALEILTNGLLLVIIVVLGPLIRRFGQIYAAAVFRAHPPTARRFLALLDVAYYLVFAAFVLIEARIDPDPAWLTPGGLAEHAQHLLERVGNMLLLMGLLHSVTIVMLPLLGLIFADGWRRLPAEARAAPADPPPEG